MDRISVVVPTFNAAATLTRCLLSLLDQTIPMHEIIVVDDGSTDQSVSIAQALAADHPEILVHLQRNAGVSAARNSGIDIATGDFIGFVDPDDFVDPSMYEKMLNKAKLDKLQVVALGEATIKTARPIVGGWAPESSVVSAREALLGLLALTYPSSVWAHLYTLELIGQVRFDTRIGFFEDLLFNLEILRRVEHVGLVAGELYYYQPSIGGANLSQLNDKHLSSFLVCLRIREILIEDSLPLWNELAILETTCLRTVVYKAAVATERQRGMEARIRRFSLSIVTRVLVASGVDFPTKLLTAASCVSAGAVVGLARMVVLAKRRLGPTAGRNR